jgi:hypothetical protein
VRARYVPDRRAKRPVLTAIHETYAATMTYIGAGLAGPVAAFQAGAASRAPGRVRRLDLDTRLHGHGHPIQVVFDCAAAQTRT